MADYQYDVTATLNNSVAPNKLEEELVIASAAFSQAYGGMTYRTVADPGEHITVHFPDGAITGPEESSLDATIASHDGVEDSPLGMVTLGPQQVEAPAAGSVLAHVRGAGMLYIDCSDAGVGQVITYEIDAQIMAKANVQFVMIENLAAGAVFRFSSTSGLINGLPSPKVAISALYIISRMGTENLWIGQMTLI